MARIILGVCGGIAAYKSVSVLRALTGAGHDVWVTPTASALEMVGEPTFAALSGHPIDTAIFPAGSGKVEHVERARQADAIVIAPATADTIARLRAGRADDALTATVLAARCPVLLCPAMHTAMWENPATQDNIATLRQRGFIVLEPESGALSSGDHGAGRLPEPQTIARRALSLVESAHEGDSTHDDAAPLSRSELAGVRVAISAGGTREPLDPVRFIGNRSSGKQGVELALVAARAGAQVDLAAANIAPDVLARISECGLADAITIHRVETCAELDQVMHRCAADAQVVIMCAAVSDYRPVRPAEHKMKKDGSAMRIELEETTDILASLVSARSAGQVIVGFAAETGDERASAVEHGKNKARRKGADLLVINDVSGARGFGSDDNSIIIVRADGSEVARAEGSKSHTADAVITAVIDTLAGDTVTE